MDPPSRENRTSAQTPLKGHIIGPGTRNPYFTVRLSAAVCFSAELPLPDVAITVTVYVPAGVPGAVE